MSDFPVRANFFDASALAKIYAKEYGSDALIEYFNNGSPTKFTTPFCLYEALNVLKTKWLHRNELTKSQYLEASFRLVTRYRAISKNIVDLDFSDRIIFSKTQEIAQKYSLDLSDAFQILTVKEGEFSLFCDHSVTLLVTADKGLAQAAREEGIKTWYCLDPEIPK